MPYRYALFVVGQVRTLYDNNIKSYIKECLKYFQGDIFFVLEKDNNMKIDLSMFSPREILWYKYNGIGHSALLMSYGWSQCMPLLTKYETINKCKYDIIYKTRPDLLLRNYIPKDLNITIKQVQDKIVWGETIGEYGTSLKNPAYAIKDTFNIITRSACEDFFNNFYLSIKHFTYLMHTLPHKYHCYTTYIPHNIVLHKPLVLSYINSVNGIKETAKLKYKKEHVNRTYSLYNSYCNESLLGYFLFKKHILKRKLNLKRHIVRKKGSKPLYGALSIDDDFTDIDIYGQLFIE
jgi:hypothetical protein